MALRIQVPINGARYPKGSMVTCYGTWEDANTTAVTVDYGDGSAPQNATVNHPNRTFQATHQYSYSTPLGNKTVTATSDRGESDSHTVTIIN